MLAVLFTYDVEVLVNSVGLRVTTGVIILPVTFDIIPGKEVGIESIVNAVTLLLVTFRMRVFDVVTSLPLEPRLDVDPPVVLMEEVILISVVLRLLTVVELISEMDLVNGFDAIVVCMVGVGLVASVFNTLILEETAAESIGTVVVSITDGALVLGLENVPEVVIPKPVGDTPAVNLLLVISLIMDVVRTTFDVIPGVDMLLFTGNSIVLVELIKEVIKLLILYPEVDEGTLLDSPVPLDDCDVTVDAEMLEALEVVAALVVLCTTVLNVVVAVMADGKLLLDTAAEDETPLSLLVARSLLEEDVILVTKLGTTPFVDKDSPFALVLVKAVRLPLLLAPIADVDVEVGRVVELNGCIVVDKLVLVLEEEVVTMEEIVGTKVVLKVLAALLTDGILLVVLGSPPSVGVDMEMLFEALMLVVASDTVPSVEIMLLNKGG